MIGQNLYNTVRSFSFRGVDLKTNILSTPGSSLGLGSTGINNGVFSGGSVLDRLNNLNALSGYYTKLQELEFYKNTELTNIILTIYKDYITNYINQDFEIVTLDNSVPEYEKLQKKLNTYFSQIKYTQALKENIDNYLYYKTYSFRVIWDEKDRCYKRLELENPNSVIQIRSEGNANKTDLVISRNGNIIEVDANTIVSIGCNELILGNDITNKKDNKNDEDTLIASDKLYAAVPLYYMNSAKVKEYLLKDQLISLLSIKDLIQPLLLLLRTDGNTAPDEANKLALNVENMINKYSDLSTITGANFSISELMNMVVSNIRVIPDYGSSMGDLNSIDLSKLADKIQSVRGDQDSIKELILNGAAIPRSLYSGESTKWDAIKSSQRLANRINYYINDLKLSTRLEAVKFLKWNANLDIDISAVFCNLFKKTEADYNTELANSEIISSQLDQITRIFENITRTVKDQQILDPDEWMKYCKLKLLAIDPELDKVITDKMIKDYVKSVLKERSGESEGGGGGWS
jgi:hypothetical protein